ncbi:hypothetical protein [Streptomyces sp. NPDC049944]|uniref:hypothetical protein n=1 Tax=Streptomyces sp. NPDC049944 TaxID=3155657 RepID=UPI0034394CF0
MLNDSAWFGERATVRFEHDVLDQKGISTVVILQGVDDIGFSEAAKGPHPPVAYKPAPTVSSRRLTAGYRTLIQAAHSKGLQAVGATLLPFKGSDHWGPHAARVSNEVTDWIRHSGESDAHVDFDRALAASSAPDCLDPSCASADALRPDDDGRIPCHGERSGQDTGTLKRRPTALCTVPAVGAGTGPLVRAPLRWTEHSDGMNSPPVRE